VIDAIEPRVEVLGVDMSQATLGTVLLWVGRIIGLMFFLFVGFFVIAHALSGELPNLWNATSHVRLDTLALFLMTVGGIVGWRSTGVASAMVLCGYGLWQLVEHRLPWPPSIIDIPLLVGVFYAIAWCCKNCPVNQQRPAMR
jgi:hypothetical protein